MSQLSTNPFKLSDTNKRYHTYEYYLRHTFGKKCAKITLDCGFTCPNIDGTKGYGGCIYCSGGSSGRLTSALLSPEEQYRQGISKITKKWQVDAFIPYLQAYTNTYTSPEKLKELLYRIKSLEGTVMIDIATRADCLEDEKLRILDALSSQIPITVELGLQSASDKTAKIINRGHTYLEFEDCFKRIRKIAPLVKIGVHIINGLPEENEQIMKNTAICVANLRPDLVKIHLLHVLKGTVLEEMYNRGEYTPLNKDEYVKTVCDQIELLPKETVIERLTGDGLSSELVAPMWSAKKVSVINDIDKELFRRGTYQGIFFEK